LSPSRNSIVSLSFSPGFAFWKYVTATPFGGFLPIAAG